MVSENFSGTFDAFGGPADGRDFAALGGESRQNLKTKRRHRLNEPLSGSSDEHAASVEPWIGRAGRGRPLRVARHRPFVRVDRWGGLPGIERLDR
jgi:hypothetical protein